MLMALGAWTVGWLVLLCAEKIVTFHPQPESVLRRLGIAKKTRVIPTGIDIEPYGMTNDAMTNDQVTVTYVGRLESVKGVDDFLAAAALVKKNYPQLKIQVVGWYKDGHPLVTQYQREVAFLGLRDDIAAVLGASDIFVLPSYSEGLSNALMEAMASGCACIATDVGGNRFLLQNGISGFLFPPGDREALVSHLRRLLDDPSKRVAMGKSARERIEKEFDWKVIGKKYEELLSS
jgi:glycosyltransferase involved in cell wall biosynthesis